MGEIQANDRNGVPSMRYLMCERARIADPILVAPLVPQLEVPLGLRETDRH